MDRTIIDCEPAVVIYAGATINFRDGITMTVKDSIQASPSDIVMDAGSTYEDAIVEISGMPDGQWESLTTLFPYLAYRRGQNIFAADVPLVIHTTSGRKVTVTSAVVTGYPDLQLCPDKPIFAGPVKWTGVRGNTMGWGTANSLYTDAALAFASWAAFDATAILKVNAAAVWGALGAPWSGIETEEGWGIKTTLNLQWRKNSAIGTFQAHYVGEGYLAKCKPQNVLISDVMAIQPVQGGTARRGARIATGANLVLTGAGGSPVITLTSAALREPGYQWGNERLRVGDLGFEAQRTYTAGVPQPLIVLA